MALSSTVGIGVLQAETTAAGRVIADAGHGGPDRQRPSGRVVLPERENQSVEEQ
jgi:hypothetical protein